MEFEIHITVECNNIEQFKIDCKELNIKPIIIDTLNSKQIMTSSKYKNLDYHDILLDLQTALLKKKYNILRYKVEINPKNIANVKFKYYESHIRLKLPKNYDYQNLKEECKKQNFHLSKNLFKQDNLYDYQMITYRTYKKGLSQFNQIINIMKNKLINLNIEFDKIEIEECIVDTNEELDKNWLKPKYNKNGRKNRI